MRRDVFGIAGSGTTRDDYVLRCGGALLHRSYRISRIASTDWRCAATVCDVMLSPRPSREGTVERMRE